MKIEVPTGADAVAKEAAKVIAVEVSSGVAVPGCFVVAVSGGTPRQMLCALANEPVPWKTEHKVQVDKRVAAARGLMQTLLAAGYSQAPRHLRRLRKVAALEYQQE